MSYRGRRVLVTGADGFIGSHLAEALVRDNAEVTALALYNAFDRYGWLDEIDGDVRASMTLVRGDIRDAIGMHRLAEGHDVVFHLARLLGREPAASEVDQVVMIAAAHVISPRYFDSSTRSLRRARWISIFTFATDHSRIEAISA